MTPSKLARLSAAIGHTQSPGETIIELRAQVERFASHNARLMDAAIRVYDRLHELGTFNEEAELLRAAIANEVKE